MGKHKSKINKETIIEPIKDSIKKAKVVKASSQKATKAEIEKRVAWCYNLMMEGRPNSTIVHLGSEKWKITERQVSDYVSRAQERFKEILQRTMEENAAFIANQYVDVIQRSKKLGEFRATNESLKELSKLMQVQKEEPTKINVTHVDNRLPEVSDDELELILRQVRETKDSE